MITFTMPISINAGQFLVFTALTLVAGAAIGFAVALKIAERIR